MGSPVLQLRVPEDTLERLDAARGDDSRSAWVLRLIERELTAPVPASPAPRTASPATVALTPGEPSPGTACAGPRCWQRDTARYGINRIPLCLSCAASLRGETYQRELPPGAARVTGRATA